MDRLMFALSGLGCLTTVSPVESRLMRRLTPLPGIRLEPCRVRTGLLKVLGRVGAKGSAKSWALQLARCTRAPYGRLEVDMLDRMLDDLWRLLGLPFNDSQLCLVSVS